MNLNDFFNNYLNIIQNNPFMNELYDINGTKIEVYYHLATRKDRSVCTLMIVKAFFSSPFSEERYKLLNSMIQYFESNNFNVILPIQVHFLSVNQNTLELQRFLNISSLVSMQ